MAECICCRVTFEGMTPEQAAIWSLVAIRKTSIGSAETHLCAKHRAAMLDIIAAWGELEPVPMPEPS